MSTEVPWRRLVAAALLCACAGTLAQCRADAAPAEPRIDPLQGGTRDASAQTSVTPDAGAPPEPMVVTCGGETCNGSSGPGNAFACCTANDACGLFLTYLYSECKPTRQKGTPDDSCPTMQIYTYRFTGCCLPEGVCGVNDTFVGFGCLHIDDLGRESVSTEPRHCPGPPPSCDPASANDPCERCMQKRCCTEWLACENDLRCYPKLPCVLDCMRQPTPQNGFPPTLVGCTQQCAFEMTTFNPLLSCLMGGGGDAGSGSSDGGSGRGDAGRDGGSSCSSACGL